MRTKLLAVAAVIGLAAVVAAQGVAKPKPRFGSTLTIVATKDQPSGGYLISGKLKSHRGGCKGGRLVKLYLHSADIGPGFSSIAQTNTKADGSWTTGKDYPVRPGKYYAKVGPKSIGAGTCKGDRSPTITGAPFASRR